MSEKASTSFNGSDKHVQVIARPRPLSDNERAQNLSSCLSVNEGRREIIVNCRTSNTRYFNYDHVFGFQTRQQEVYKTVVAPIVDEVLKGYSSTIFAYGQTGSGKTHTMLGKFPMDKLSRDAVAGYMSILESEAGIMPRAVHHIFQGLQRQYVDYTVKITYLELYNEELTDLLADATNEQPEKIKIYEDKDKNNTIIGATEAAVETPFDAFKVLVKGSQRRQTAETLMNASSSRSHSIFTMTVTMKDAQGDMRFGKLHLVCIADVDLAGSENISRSGATDKRAREAGTINQSLLTLGRVITALISNEKHICYRDSKLTRILQDSLCGKTITSIIITLSPANEAETLSTLEYGHRARSLKIRPEINQLTSRDLVREYVDEIRRLRQELDAKREADGVPYSQYLALKNQMTVIQTLADNNQSKLDNHEQQMEQYRTEIDNLRRQMTSQQQELRTELNERKEMQALNRYRYEELVQMTQKALTSRDQASNAIQQLRSFRSSSSTMVDQCIQDCRSMGENLHTHVQRITDDIQTVLTTCAQSTGQVLSLSANLGQQMYLLNEKVRHVLSLAFQQFHTIFEEINRSQNHFQTELDREFSSLIDRLALEMKIESERNQRHLHFDDEETINKIRACFQEMSISLNPSSQSLWQDLYTCLTQSFTQMLTNQFQTIMPIDNDTSIRNDPLLDLNTIRCKWLDEQERQILVTQAEVEGLITDLIRNFTEFNPNHSNETNSSQNTTLLQCIREMCLQHARDLRHLLETKLQTVFSQVRDEYDEQCETLLKSMERDITQINGILQDFNTKVENSLLTTSIHDSMSNLLKQSQRIDVIIKNLEYDWQMIRQTAEQFDGETILLSAPVALPKSDAVLKQELALKDLSLSHPVRSVENKENLNVFDSAAMPHSHPNRPAVAACRLKNDTPFF